MTWLKFLNYYILQWFFIRIARCTQKNVTSFDLKEASLMSNGNMAIGGSGDIQKIQWYSIMYWTVPLTGWGDKFVFLNKKDQAKYIRITRKKNKNKK